MVVTLVAMVTNNLRQRPLLRVAYGYIIYESTRSFAFALTINLSPSKLGSLF